MPSGGMSRKSPAGYVAFSEKRYNFVAPYGPVKSRERVTVSGTVAVNMQE